MRRRFEISKVFVTYLLLALVSAQFALAQHSVLHLDLNSYPTQQNTHDDEHDSAICQTCVTAKNLTQKYLPQSNYYFSLQKTDYQIFPTRVFANLQSLNKPFRSQAPPILFS